MIASTWPLLCSAGVGGGPPPATIRFETSAPLIYRKGRLTCPHGSSNFFCLVLFPFLLQVVPQLAELFYSPRAHVRHAVVFVAKPLPRLKILLEATRRCSSCTPQSFYVFAAVLGEVLSPLQCNPLSRAWLY